MTDREDERDKAINIVGWLVAGIDPDGKVPIFTDATLIPRAKLFELLEELAEQNQPVVMVVPKVLRKDRLNGRSSLPLFCWQDFTRFVIVDDRSTNDYLIFRLVA